MTNLYTRLAKGFPAGDRPFAQLPGGGVVSYGEVEARSAGFAHVLRDHGVGIGDRVAVQAEKSIDMLMLYLGCLRAGAVFLPLNPAYTPGELDYFMRDAEPALFVCDPAAVDKVSPLATAAGVPRVAGLAALADDAAAAPARFDTVERGDDDLAAILYTSGTTGRSKGAMLSHDNLGSNAFMIRDAWHFTGDDVLLHALPIFHTHGLFVATNTLIVAGGAMLFLPRFDVRELIRLMPRATTLMGVPTFYSRLLGEADFPPELAAPMRLFISGSAPLSAETHKEFSARTGKAILERYGMTETNMNTSNPYDGERVPGSVGFPLPGVELRITDPESPAGEVRVLPQGEVGVIEVRGPNVFQGYWRQTEKTAEDLRPDGWFITGDMGVVDTRGYVSIVGRAKDLIICGGLNVYPAEVEALIDAIPGIAESAVIGVPHPDMGEGVVAVVQASDKGLDEAAVMAALEGQLARFKQPRRVIFLPELPRNAMGKIQKKQLRETYAGCFTGG